MLELEGTLVVNGNLTVHTEYQNYISDWTFSEGAVLVLGESGTISPNEYFTEGPGVYRFTNGVWVKEP